MRVLVAMSGGVDSSVAAARLAADGHDVTGVTLKLWGGTSDRGCCSVADVEDARRVAAQLGIPHYVFELTERFADRVVDPYVRAHAGGRTPNPCVDCNRHIKFGELLHRANRLGFDAIATGHHARRSVAADGTVGLRRGADSAKDQSYVIAMLTQAQLARVQLPIGELTKHEVRAEAARLGLRTAAKAESMDVCFIRKGGRREFLGSRLDLRPGPVVDRAGAVVGRHDGTALVTVGQRRGLGVAAGERRFVLDVDPGAATVTIGTASDLTRRRQPVSELTVTGAPIAPHEVLDVQVRAHGATAAGRLQGGEVVWEEPQPRVAPGQLVAFYRGDTVAGSAVAA